MYGGSPLYTYKKVWIIENDYPFLMKGKPMKDIEVLCSRILEKAMDISGCTQSMAECSEATIERLKVIRKDDLSHLQELVIELTNVVIEEAGNEDKEHTEA